MKRRFVLFELNEVPMRVVDHYVARHPQSAFARIVRHGAAMTTLTPDEGHLSPWITWPTLHRGVKGDRHGIIALGQGVADADRRFPPLWTLLARAGRRVGLFGSLHSYPLPADVAAYDFYVPDTFAAGPEAHPADLSAFQTFNLQMVDRSGRNVSSGIDIRGALNFLIRALPAGLRSGTLVKVGRQLAAERVWKHRTARRRTIQSLLAFDLFFEQWRSRKPDAAFFFTNHVASAMHRYWPATFTADYARTEWKQDWVQRFAGEVDYAMGEADEMLAKLLDMADRDGDCMILVAGSMGQAAVDEPDRQVTTEVLVRDIDRFVAALGVEASFERRRTMEPTYTLQFDGEDHADCFLAALAALKVAGKPVDHRALGGGGVEFVLGHSNIAAADFTVTLGNRAVAPTELGIANVPIEDEVGAAAYHVPEGMLLVYDPSRPLAVPAETISTTRIAPTLLALQGVAPEPYMEQPIAALLEPALEAA